MSLASFALSLTMLPAAATEAPPEAAPVVTAVDAPAPPPRNIVFAEALGSALLYSVNYERLFDDGRFGLRGGASFFTYGVSSHGAAGNLTIVSFPLVASYYFAWDAHRLQLGLGATVLHTDVATDSNGVAYGGERAGTAFAPSGVVGYRYVPRRSGISFGLAFTPLVRATKLLPWGGITVGYAF